jgi:hypothetical protein
MNLRAQAEADLATTLEDVDGFGMPVILIAPDGTVIDKKAGTTVALTGQIVYDSTETSEIGIPTIVHKPVVTLRRSSLSRIPLPTDRPRWACRVPVSPLVGAPLATFLVENPTEGGGTLGFVRLYLTRAEQSVAP